MEGAAVRPGIPEGGGGRRTNARRLSAGRSVGGVERRDRASAAARRSAEGNDCFSGAAEDVEAGIETPSHSETEGRSVIGRGAAFTGGTPGGSEPDHSDGARERRGRSEENSNPPAIPVTTPTPKPP